jgi:hypothetical protein
MSNRINGGNGSRVVSFRLSEDDYIYFKSLADRKGLSVNAFVRSNLIDFLAKEAIRDWARTEVAELRAGNAGGGSSSAQSENVLGALFATYHMVYEIVNARDPKAAQRAIELGQREAADELRHAAPRKP